MISTIKKLIKWSVIALIFIVLFAITASLLFGTDTPDTNVESDDSSATINDSHENVQDIVNESYSINTAELEDLSYQQINLWRSFSDRTKVGVLDVSQDVNLISEDSQNNYCQIKQDEVEGWLSCDWLLR
jgi:hypothetical protein